MFDYNRIGSLLCKAECTPDWQRFTFAFPFLEYQIKIIYLSNDFNNFTYDPKKMVFEIKKGKEIFRIPGEEIAGFRDDGINFYLTKEWRRNEQSTYN